METKIVAKIFRYGIELFEKDSGILQSRGLLQNDYALDRELTSLIRNRIEESQPFLKTTNETFYNLGDELGTVILLEMKCFQTIRSLREKLFFLEQTQFMTLFSERKYSELEERLSVFLMTRKIQGQEE